MKKLLAALLVCCASGAWAQTGTPKTQTQMSTEIGTTGCVQPTCQFPDNTTGLITPLGLRTALQDLNATLFGAKVFYATSYGVKCDGGTTNDTAAINTALLAAANQVLVFPSGSCLVTPGGIVIGAGVANVPAQMLGYGTLIFANAVVASPLITIDTPETSLGSAVFTFAGFRFSCTGGGAGKGAYALKIHGSQFATYRDLEMVGGCTTGGLWLSGDLNFGIYNNLFEHIIVQSMAGSGIIAKSVNPGTYYISANTWSGITSVFNTGHGFDSDWASIALFGGDLESNTLAGINVDNSIQIDLNGIHLEGNGGNAIATTANSNGVRVSGGRSSGTITAGALTNAKNSFNTSDASANPISRFGGADFVTAGAAWTAYTPTLTCGTATFGTVTARAKTLGKTTWAQIEFTITAIGTCTQPITFTLPNTANSGGAIVGYENVTANTMVSCLVTAASATATCGKPAAAAFGVNNHVIASGVYENQ